MSSDHRTNLRSESETTRATRGDIKYDNNLAIAKEAFQLVVGLQISAARKEIEALIEEMTQSDI